MTNTENTPAPYDFPNMMLIAGELLTADAIREIVRDQSETVSALLDAAEAYRLAQYEQRLADLAVQARWEIDPKGRRSRAAKAAHRRNKAQAAMQNLCEAIAAATPEVRADLEAR